MTDALSIAMQMPDDGVSKGSRKQPTSLTSQIAALEVDECCSKAVKVDAGDLASMTSIKKGLSDSANSSVRGAKNRNGLANAEYRIETMQNISGHGNVYAMAIITRVK